MLQRKIKNSLGAKLFKEYTINKKTRSPDFLKNVKVFKDYDGHKTVESSDDSMTPVEHFKQILDMI